MSDTLMFMPPCCVAEKLPKAILQSPRRSLTFYTHGDVSMERFYRAISYMVDGRMNMFLSMPVPDDSVIAFLSMCFDKNEISNLFLSTSRDVSTYVQRRLGKYNKHVIYVCGKDVNQLSSHMVLFNSKRALCLNGPMISGSLDCSLVSYTCNFYNDLGVFTSNMFGHSVLNAVFPDIMRIHRLIRTDQLNEKSEYIRSIIDYYVSRIHQ